MDGGQAMEEFYLGIAGKPNNFHINLIGQQLVDPNIFASKLGVFITLFF